MKSLKVYLVIISCLVMGFFLVWASGRVDIPNKGHKTNMFSFQDSDIPDFNVVTKGLPFKYNKTFYKSDPNDSCTICNNTHSAPCLCGMPPQVYYSDINWLVASLDLLIASILLFVISQSLRLVKIIKTK